MPTNGKTLAQAHNYPITTFCTTYQVHSYTRSTKKRKKVSHEMYILSILLSLVSLRYNVPALSQEDAEHKEEQEERCTCPAITGERRGLIEVHLKFLKERITIGENIE